MIACILELFASSWRIDDIMTFFFFIYTRSNILFTRSLTQICAYIVKGVHLKTQTYTLNNSALRHRLAPSVDPSAYIVYVYVYRRFFPIFTIYMGCVCCTISHCIVVIISTKCDTGRTYWKVGAFLCNCESYNNRVHIAYSRDFPPDQFSHLFFITTMRSFSHHLCT